jgi:hypothetical protein
MSEDILPKRFVGEWEKLIKVMKQIQNINKTEKSNIIERLDCLVTKTQKVIFDTEDLHNDILEMVLTSGDPLESSIESDESSKSILKEMKINRKVMEKFVVPMMLYRCHLEENEMVEELAES